STAPTRVGKRRKKCFLTRRAHAAYNDVRIEVDRRADEISDMPVAVHRRDDAGPWETFPDAFSGGRGNAWMPPHKRNRAPVLLRDPEDGWRYTRAVEADPLHWIAPYPACGPRQSNPIAEDEVHPANIRVVSR